MKKRRFVNRRNRQRKMFFSVLFVLLFILGIGYSNLETFLNVDGNVTVSKYSPTFMITLDNQSASSIGTGEIYESYSNGFYLDESLQNEMTSNTFSITVPTKQDYVFGGYYTEVNGGGVQYIDENGFLTSNASPINFNDVGTLYANWLETIELSVSSTSDTYYVKDTIDVTATTNSDFSGSVVFTAVGNPEIVYKPAVSNGTAAFSIKGLAYGNYTFEAVAVPSIPNKYAASPVVSISFLVDKRSSSISVVPKDASYGKTLTLSGRVPSSATGTVKAVINSQEYFTDVINGTYKFSINGLEVGSYTAYVTYLGDDQYYASETKTAPFKILKSTAPTE